MNVWKRSVISLYRQPLKSLLFLGLVVVLSSLTAGALLVRQAIANTDQNLRNRMPAVVTVGQDAERIYEETGEWPPFVSVPPEVIRQIGAFDEVSTFDYAIDLRWSVTAQGLEPWENPDFLFQMGADYDEDLGVRLRIEGVSRPDFLDIRDSFLELVSGASFTEEQMGMEAPPFPALVASGFAQANGLSIGSVFETQIIVFETTKTSTEFIEDRESPPLVEASFPLEVIGIFDPITATLPEGAEMDDLFQADRWESLMQHRIFVPNVVAEQMFEVQTADPFGQEHIWIQNFFILEDPLDFESFALQVENLEGEWIATDFSSGFRDIAAAMANMEEVAHLILVMAIGATLLTLSLVLLLLLRERRFEIGVYLALGEKKKKIVGQMLMELIPLVIMGMTMALILGNALAPVLSRDMLRRNMLAQQSPFLVLEGGNPLEHFGYRFELNQEEMFESFELGMDQTAIFLFYAIAFSTVMIAIMIPVGHAVYQAPRQLLLNKGVQNG